VTYREFARGVTGYAPSATEEAEMAVAFVQEFAIQGYELHDLMSG
jgi:hypothetical protein